MVPVRQGSKTVAEFCSRGVRFLYFFFSFYFILFYFFLFFGGEGKVREESSLERKWKQCQSLHHVYVKEPEGKFTTRGP